ncbi:hypothetical protein JB92DRAFT_3128706 [Gautieria morchelliformis]|nr:hypothetical protein JB92DRAFT_3128706 [Gautieria morchelliformis]
MSRGFVRSGGRTGAQLAVSDEGSSKHMPAGPQVGASWRQVGDAPLALIPRGTIIASYLGLAHVQDQPHGTWLSASNVVHLAKAHVAGTAGTAVCVGTQAVMYRSTRMGWIFPTTVLVGNANSASVKVCKTLTLMNGDVCDPKAWVLFLPGAEGSENPSDRARVGRIVEVLRVAGSAADMRAQQSAILVENWVAHHSTAPYNMPRLCRDEQPHTLLEVQALLCNVNVQHNCARNACQASGMVTHTGDIDDIVLNVCQMRDAHHLAHLRPRVPHLNRDHIIHMGAAMELAARNGSSQRGDSSASSAIRARGWGLFR